MSVTTVCLCARVGGYRAVVLSLHYERMTTNEEICWAILRFTSANYEPFTHANMHTARDTRPFMLWHSAVGWERNRNEVKKKEKNQREMRKPQRSRLVGWKKDRGREVWLRRRGAGEWNEKIERGDGWERRGWENSRELHSSAAFIIPFS